MKQGDRQEAKPQDFAVAEQAFACPFQLALFDQGRRRNIAALVAENQNKPAGYARHGRYKVAENGYFVLDWGKELQNPGCGA